MQLLLLARPSIRLHTNIESCKGSQRGLTLSSTEHSLPQTQSVLSDATPVFTSFPKAPKRLCMEAQVFVQGGLYCKMDSWMATRVTRGTFEAMNAVQSAFSE